MLSLIAFTLLYGTSGLISAALAAGMVLFFYVVGQLVMVMFADAGARTLLVVSMTSYTGRVVVLGLVLLLYSRYSDRWPTLEPMVIFFTTIAVVIGLVGGRDLRLLPPANRHLRHRIHDSTEHNGPAVTLPIPAASVCSAMEQGRDSTSAEQPQKSAHWAGADQGMRVLSYLIAGVCLYGLLGWLGDHLLGTGFLLPLGIVFGAAASIYVIIRRFGRVPDAAGSRRRRAAACDDRVRSTP